MVTNMNKRPQELPKTSMCRRIQQENMCLHSWASKQLLQGRSVSPCFTGPHDHMFLMEASCPLRPHTSGPDFRLQLLFMTPELLLKNDLRQLLLWPLPPHLKLHLPRLPYPGNLSSTLHYGAPPRRGRGRIKIRLEPNVGIKYTQKKELPPILKFNMSVW